MHQNFTTRAATRRSTAPRGRTRTRLPKPAVWPALLVGGFVLYLAVLVDLKHNEKLFSCLNVKLGFSFYMIFLFHLISFCLCNCIVNDLNKSNVYH